MTDIWRNWNPDARIFTWRRNDIASRIDYILTEIGITSWFHDVRIIPGFRSDHSAILANLTPFGVKRGRGLWKLNTKILTEVEFIAQLNNAIENSKILAANQNPQEKMGSYKIEHNCNSSKIFTSESILIDYTEETNQEGVIISGERIRKMF